MRVSKDATNEHKISLKFLVHNGSVPVGWMVNSTLPKRFDTATQTIEACTTREVAEQLMDSSMHLPTWCSLSPSFSPEIAYSTRQALPMYA